MFGAYREQDVDVTAARFPLEAYLKNNVICITMNRLA